MAKTNQKGNFVSRLYLAS